MTNRKRITNALKEAGYKINTLEFISNYRYDSNGESVNDSYWRAETECGKIFSSDNGDSVIERVDFMIEDILESAGLRSS